MLEFYNFESLYKYLVIDNNYKLVPVCGYDNVGKGNLLKKFNKINPIFYPDYELICNTVPKDKRWTYFMYFLDLYNKFGRVLRNADIMVFDRSAICGAVYNNDESIAELYSKLVNNLSICHILIKCTESDYYKLQDVRDSDTTFEYSTYLEYTNRYEYYFNKYNINYVIFNNVYNEDLAYNSKYSCGGCSFNKYGICTNKYSGREKVSDDMLRCDHTSEKEVQDLDE